MLARQHSPGGDAHPHDLLAGGVHPLHHAGLTLVEHQERVEVAVSGMEHVHDDQLVAGGDLVHLREHLDQAGPRHDGVVQVVVRLDPGDGAKGGLSALPDQCPLRVVRRHPDRASAVAPTDPRHAGDAILDRGREAVELDDENRGGVRREAGVHVRLHRPRDGSVHHLQRRRHQAGGDDRADRGGAVLHPLEVEQQRADRGRVLCESHAHPGSDTEHPLAADEHAPQVQAGGLGVLAPEDGDGAVGQHDLDGQDVHRRHALGQTMGSAGVGGDVAAHRAALLARGIRGVVDAMLGQLMAEVGVEHPRLDPGLAGVEVEAEEPVHLRGDDHDRVVHGHRAAGQPGARTAGDERHTVGAGGDDAAPHLLRRGREDHDRGGALHVGGVAPVEVAFAGPGAHPPRTEGGAELRDEGRARSRGGGHVWTVALPRPAAGERVWCPDGKGRGSGRPPRVGLVRGSRGGTDLGLRRHVPHVVLVAASTGTVARVCSPGRPSTCSRGAAATAPTSSTTKTWPRSSRRPPG